MSYTTKTVAELKTIAKTKGIRWSEYKNLRKAELITLIRSRRTSPKPTPTPAPRPVRRQVLRLTSKPTVKSAKPMRTPKKVKQTCKDVKVLRGCNPIGEFIPQIHITRNKQFPLGMYVNSDEFTKYDNLREFKVLINEAYQKRRIKCLGVERYIMMAMMDVFINIRNFCQLEVFNDKPGRTLKTFITKYISSVKRIKNLLVKHNINGTRVEILVKIADKCLSHMKSACDRYESDEVTLNYYHYQVLPDALKMLDIEHNFTMKKK